MENSSTLFSNKCGILAELWSDYRDEEQFQDFVQYADLGLPLAFCHASEIISIETDSPAQEVVEEAWNVFVYGLGFEQDEGFESLDEILNKASLNRGPSED